MKKLRRLLPSQRPAFAYARKTDRVALLMEMRLGKTTVAIRRAKLVEPLSKKTGLRVLIVAPNSTGRSWQRELAAERETDLVFLHGTGKQRLKLLREAHKWSFINKEGWRALRQIADVSWDVIIVDESTFLKNPKARVTKFFLSQFPDVPVKMILTGMVAPEGPEDVWCQMAFLHGGWLGHDNFWAFRAAMFHPAGFRWVPNRGVAALIERALARDGFVLSRTDVGMDKVKVRERRELDLPLKLRRAYETVERKFVLEYAGKRSSTIFSACAWTWLRQMCGGFTAKSGMVWKGKLRELVSLVTGELAGQQIVVWFAYNQELRSAAKELRKAKVHAEVMLGATPVAARRKLEHDFGRGWFRVFLVQEAVAQFGSDFSSASAAIYFGNSPSCQQRAQSEDRILHPKKNGPLLYVDLVVRDTVDEDVTEMVLGKKRRSEAMLRRAVAQRMRGRYES